MLIAAAAVGLLTTGCVQRRMTIRSNPPGAQVYIDNQEIGRTPVSTDFIYYGRRDIRLVKDGYETLQVKQSIWAPWYEWPVLAFFAENVVPFELRDERRFDYQMQPAMVVPSQTLLSRAEELRAAQIVSPVVPAQVGPPTAVPTQPLTSPYLPTPQYVSPPQAPTTYTPPPAILNYPPSSATPTVPQAPNVFPAPTSSAPVMQLPGDYGGRPVPPIP
jgi:hypothetical protein